MSLRGLLSLTLVAALGSETGAVRPRQISESGAGAYEASLTPFENGMAMAWYDTRNARPEIYARLTDAAGAAIGPELRLAHSQRAAYEPDVAVADGNLVVAWYETAESSQSQAMLGSWTREGAALWTTPLSPNELDARSPIVRVSGDQMFCAWLQASSEGELALWARWFDRHGAPLDRPRRIAPAGRTTWNLNGAIDSRGRAWVAFDAVAGTRSEELFLATIDRTSIDVQRVTTDDGNASKYPDIAFSGGRIALTWFDTRDGNEEVYLWSAASDRVKSDDMKNIDRRARRVTDTKGESIGAYVAWNHNRIGLAWCDNTSGQQEIYFEPFDASGRPLSPPRRITDTATESLIPAIRPSRNGFLLVWNEFTPGPDGAHDSRGRSEVYSAFVEP